MQQSKWRRMVAWALVGVLMVALWATPGWARKPKEEKLKPIEGEIAGLLVALEDEWPEVKKLAFDRLAEFDGQALRGTLKQPEVLAKKAFDIFKDEKIDASILNVLPDLFVSTALVLVDHLARQQAYKYLPIYFCIQESS